MERKRAPDVYIVSETADKKEAEAFKRGREYGYELGTKNSAGVKTLDGGEIFNDYENNIALAPNSHTQGQENISGSKCFKFDLEHEYTPLTDWAVVNYDEQGNATAINGWYYLTSVEGIEPEMIYSIVLKANYEYNGKVLGVDSDNKRIYVSNYYIPVLTEYLISEDSYIHFPDYPELGTDIIGIGASARGIKNKALSDGADTSGIENTSAGKYSTTHGKKNKAGYGADAGGQETEATADLSMSRGYKTKATGNKSTALGEVTKASGENALAHGQMPTDGSAKKGASGKNSRTGGYDNEATGLNSEATGSGNSAQAGNSFVSGLDNKSEPKAKNSFVAGAHNTAVRENQTVIGEFADTLNEPDALLVIGNGTGRWQGNRSNAFVVRKNGQIVGKALPKSREDLANKGYVDDSIQNEILDKFDRQDASFIFNNKRYYLTDIYKDDGYCIFSDETEMTNVRFHISQKIDNIPDIIIEMNYQYKKLFSDFNENYFTYSKYMIGTNDDDDYKYWSVSPYSIPTVDEVKSFFKYNNIELSKLEKIWIRSLFYYNNNPYIRFSKPQGNWGNIHLVVEGEYDTTGSVYSTTRTEDTYHCPVYMFMTYINRSFFLENHLNVYFMGTKFKELLGTMFTVDELRLVYSESEISAIFGYKEIEKQIGDIDTALDSIIAMQNELIGGDA